MRSVATSMKSKRLYKYCILATPKTGTFSVSQWVEGWEVIGHESHDCHGIVSGFWFQDHDWYPFGHDADMQDRDIGECMSEVSDYTRSDFLYQNVIALARRPLSVINSLYKWLVENDGRLTRGTDGDLYKFNEWYEELGFDMSGDTLDQAIEIWVQTYKRIFDSRVDHVIKLEEFAQRWEEITGTVLPPEVKKNQSGKTNPFTDEEILARMSPEQRETYEAICEKLGY